MPLTVGFRPTHLLVAQFAVHQTLARRIFIAIAATWLVCFLDGGDRPAWAEAESVVEGESVVINMPVYGQVAYSDLVVEAEALANDAVSRQFSQNPGLSTVRVVVLGNRNGEMIPVLETAVSREQWQTNPQVGAWARYYASYGLIQRHGGGEQVAIAPANSSGSTSSAAQNRSAQIDEALDEGRLTGRAAQDYLSDLD